MNQLLRVARNLAPVSPARARHCMIRRTFAAGPASTVIHDLSYQIVNAKEGAPTAVFVHGIMGSGRNLTSFAKRVTTSHRDWQVLLVDLRAHGESGAAANGPNSVHAAANDVLALLRRLKLFPRALVGHSFGGKICLEMLKSFTSGGGDGRPPPALPRPVRVWVLDTTPGGTRQEGPDHPADVIPFVRGLKAPFESRAVLIDALLAHGFSQSLASWMGTNLKAGNDGLYEWTIQLDDVQDLYQSYEQTDYWEFLANLPRGASVSFVKASKSLSRWSGGEAERLEALGCTVETVVGGHWIVSDNPSGLLRVLNDTFSGI